MSCALLDPASSASRARPLHQWSRARKEAVQSHFAEIHRAWCADWLPTDDASAHGDTAVWLSDSEAESAFVPKGWTAFWSFADATVVMPGYTALHAIARAMFGLDAVREVSGIADVVARAAWTDWLRRLTTSPALEGSELQEVAPPKDGIPAMPWSGALWLRWRWCGGFWRLALPREAVAAWAGAESAEAVAPAVPAPPTTGLDRALAHEKVILRAALGGAELNLGQLQSLRIGDVIPLQHRLDTPLKVITGEGTELCEGWLGRRQGRIAIEMALPAGHQTNNPSLKEITP